MTENPVVKRSMIGKSSPPAPLFVAVGCGIVVAAIAFLLPHKEAGYLCTICGAQKKVMSRPLGHTSMFVSEIVEETKVSKIRLRLLGRCAHDWVFAYGQLRSVWGGEAGCGRPELDYEIGLLPDRLVAGLNALPSDAERRQALLAIGDRHNELRNLAAAAVFELAYRESLSPSQMGTWLESHHALFRPCQDKAAAVEIAHRWSESDDSLIQAEAETFLSKSKAQ